MMMNIHQFTEKVESVIDGCQKPKQLNGLSKWIDSIYNRIVQDGYLKKDNAEIWRNKMKSKLLMKALSFGDVL